MSGLNLLIQELEKRKAYLENLQSITQKQLKNVPSGKLRISKNKGILRYYHITDPKDTRGKYISKENQEMVNQLAQKDYLSKLSKEIQSELQDINNYLKKHQLSNLENIYSNQNDYRKQLIKPMVIPDELFIKQWMEESYETNPYFIEHKVYPSKKGELMRSKSEVLIADMYYELGIPYRYDAELILKNGKKKYPDFTLLNSETRQIIYHEHLGLMDEEGYRRDNLRKLDEYRRNGIYPGKNLILTFEAEGSYLNIHEIKKMVKELFKIEK